MYSSCKNTIKLFYVTKNCTATKPVWNVSIKSKNKSYVFLLNTHMYLYTSILERWFLSFRDITTMKGTIVAQVDSSESFQEFCSTSCLSFYEDKQNPSKGVLNKSRCTICGKLTEVWLTFFSFSVIILITYSEVKQLKMRKFKIGFSIFICCEILRRSGIILMKSNWMNKEFKYIHLFGNLKCFLCYLVATVNTFIKHRIMYL